MSSIAPPAPAPVAHDERQAQALGLPPTLFGLPPSHKSYWYEPGLPWATQGPCPASSSSACYRMPNNDMAPRFPCGVVVRLRHVPSRTQLMLGKPYVYSFADTDTGEVFYQAGRLAHIAGHYIGALADNDPGSGLVWPVDRAEGFAGVWLVEAYVSYPAEAVADSSHRS